MKIKNTSKRPITIEVDGFYVSKNEHEFAQSQKDWYDVNGKFHRYDEAD